MWQHSLLVVVAVVCVDTGAVVEVAVVKEVVLYNDDEYALI